MNITFNRYSEQENDLLNLNWGKSIKEIQKILPNRSSSSLRNRAKFLGLVKTYDKCRITPKKLTDIEKGYFAGHFDGEGCIMMRLKPNGAGTIRIAVGISSFITLEKYANAFNGTIRPLQSTNKPLNQWVLSSFSDCKHFLDLLTPYLIEKQSQAIIALEWLNWRISKNYRHKFNNVDLEFTNRIFYEIKSLKK